VPEPEYHKTDNPYVPQEGYLPFWNIEKIVILKLFSFIRKRHSWIVFLVEF
jgi:hypothetical protein